LRLGECGWEEEVKVWMGLAVAVAEVEEEEEEEEEVEERRPLVVVVEDLRLVERMRPSLSRGGT